MPHSRRKLTTVLGSGITIGAFALLALTPALSAQAATTGVQIGVSPVGLGVNENNHRVIVSNGGLRVVTIFDGSEAFPTRMDLALSDEPAGVAVDSGLQLAFVTLPAAGKVAVIDLGAATPVVLRSITVGTAPSTVAVNRILHRVFVVNNGSATVSSFIGDDAAPTVTTIAVGASPEGIGIDTANHTVFVASQSTGTLSRFDGASATPAVTTLAGFPNAGAIAADNRTHDVFVVDGVDNELLRFTSTDVAPTPTTLFVGGILSGVAVDSESGEVYVTSRSSNLLSHFDGTIRGAATVVTDIVGNGPQALAIDQTLPSRTVYLANRGGTTVSRVDGVLPAAPVITSGAPPAATVGVPYTFQFKATAHPAASFSAVVPAASHFSLNSFGLLTGTATSAGPVTFVLTASNGISPSATQTVTIPVNAAPTTTPTPTPSPTGTVAPSSTATPTSTGTPTTGGGAGSGGGTGGNGAGSGGAGSGGSGSGGSAGSGGGGLAHTGQTGEALAPVGLAALLLSAVGAAMVMERRAASRRKRL